MYMIADLLLLAGAVGAGIYCHVLSRRLQAFTALEAGMGNAIAVLSVQVDEMTVALSTAQNAAGAAETRLADLSGRAVEAETRLSLMLAALHDVPGAPSQADAAVQTGRRVRVTRRRLAAHDDLVAA
jgi:hypothetical protein